MTTSSKIPLFVYGVLRPDIGNSTFPECPATVLGFLFDFGQYPCFEGLDKTDIESPPKVFGHILYVTDKFLQSVDGYEGCAVDRLRSSLSLRRSPPDPIYRRVRIQAVLGWEDTEDPETVECFIYELNKEVSRKHTEPRIHSGDWLKPNASTAKTTASNP